MTKVEAKVRLLLSMSFTQKEAIKRIEALAEPLVDHCACLYLYPNAAECNLWSVEVFSITRRIWKVINLKGSRRMDASLMERLLTDKVLDDLRDFETLARTAYLHMERQPMQRVPDFKQFMDKYRTLLSRIYKEDLTSSDIKAIFAGCFKEAK
jgi:hypothetical protein